MEGEALPRSSAEAAKLVASCLQTWDAAGGKAQLLTALSDAASAQRLAPEEPHQALLDLLQALLLSHSLEAHLNEQGIVSLFERLRATTNGVEADDLSTADGDEDAVVQAIIESIWATDLELDVRTEVSPVKGSLLPSPTAFQSDDTKSVPVEEARGRLAGVVRALIHAGYMSRDDAAERFENALLAAIGVVENAEIFAKKAVRIRTALSYKQQKFNLLREENEGYSALISEIIHSMGPPIVAASAPGSEPRAREQESGLERDLRAQQTMSNISTLIGYYDLDPNRVLDLILEVFMSNYLKHWPYFLALITASPWGRASSPRTKTAGGEAATSAAKEESAMDVDEHSTLEADTRVGPVDVSLNSERGNTTCAQILGLKFQYFQGEEALKQRTAAPESIYHVAAHLIRAGFVRLSELRTHLTPDAKGLQKVQDQYQQSLRDQVANARGNALTMASVLIDDTKVDGSDAEIIKKAAVVAASRDPPNQLVELVRALLALGQLKPALYILGEHPWLCGAFPEIAVRYTRLLETVLAPAYASVSYSATRPNISNKSISAPRLRYDVKKQEVVALPPPRLVLTPLAPPPLATSAVRLVFYVSDWESGLPSCSSPESVIVDFASLLAVLGVHLHRNFALFQQLCRLGASHLDEKGEFWSTSDGPSRERIKAGWLNIIRVHLLPALSLTHQNAGLGAELWKLLSCLSYPERFSLYGEWKYNLYKRPELRPRQLETEKEAKGILKRISKENVKESGRKLAKESHANPTIFFAVALHQVQAYDNLIPHVVESVKYLTHFEYDVFSFNLIDALSNPEKERTKQDGTNISLWLKSLAAFTGTIYKRQQLMDPRPVLQYIVNQLMANNSKDLVIVRELVLKMAGIEPLANLSDKQIDALTGGRLLRNEAMLVANAGPGTIARTAFRRTGYRLLNALKTSQLDVPLLILIAQQRQACLHLVPDNEAYLKYLGNLFDSCQEVLFQYLEFLFNYLEPQAYATLMPSLRALCLRFHIEPSIAFHIVRPQLVYNMKTIDEEDQLRAKLRAAKENSASSAKIKLEATAAADATKADEGDADATMADAKTEDAADSKVALAVIPSKVIPPAVTESGDINGIDSSSKEGKTNGTATNGTETENNVVNAVMTNGTTASGIDAANAVDVDAIVTKPSWHAGLSDAIDAAKQWLPAEVSNVLGPYFYVTFWQLALSDIDVPSERYEAEAKASKQIIRTVETDAKMPEAQKRAIRDAHQQSIKKLELEVRAQTLAHQGTRRRLQLEKGHWFPEEEETWENKRTIVDQMYQHCIFPRSLLSATDAIFAGKFIRLLQIYGTRNFSTYTLYEKILSPNIADIVFSCTENEARSYSRFLHAVLQNLMAWHKSIELFKKEVVGDGLSGFQMQANQTVGEAGDRKQLSHVDYCRIVAQWHDNLTEAFSAAIASKEYMHVRNTIVVMTRLAPLFPAMEEHGNKLQGEVEALAQKEERGDLKVLAQGLNATLKTRKKHWTPSWSFRKQEPPPKPKEEPAKAKPEPPQTTPARSVAKEGDRSTPTRSHELPTRPGGHRVPSAASVPTTRSGAQDHTPPSGPSSTAAATASDRETRTADRQPPSGPRGSTGSRLHDQAAKNARQAALESMSATRTNAISDVDILRTAPRGPAGAPVGTRDRTTELSIRGAHEAATAAAETTRKRELTPPSLRSGRQSRAGSPELRDTARVDPVRRDRDDARSKDLERERERTRVSRGGDRRELDREREKERAPGRRWGPDPQMAAAAESKATTGTSTPTGPRADRHDDRPVPEVNDRRRSGATLEEPDRKRRRTEEREEEGAADWGSRGVRPPTGPAASRSATSQSVSLSQRLGSGTAPPNRNLPGVPTSPASDLRVKADHGSSSGTEAPAGSGSSKRPKINRQKYGPLATVAGIDDLRPIGAEAARGDGGSRHERNVIDSDLSSRRDRDNGDTSRDRNGGGPSIYSSRTREGRDRERSSDKDRDRHDRDRERDRDYHRSSDGAPHGDVSSRDGDRRDRDRDKHRKKRDRRERDPDKKERDRSSRRAGDLS